MKASCSGAIMAILFAATPVNANIMPCKPYVIVSVHAHVWAPTRLYVSHVYGRDEFGAIVYHSEPQCSTDSAHPVCSAQVAGNAGNKVWTVTGYTGYSVRSRFFSVDCLIQPPALNAAGNLTLIITDNSTPTWERCHNVGLLNCPNPQ